MVASGSARPPRPRWRCRRGRRRRGSRTWPGRRTTCSASGTRPGSRRRRRSRPGCRLWSGPRGGPQQTLDHLGVDRKVMQITFQAAHEAIRCLEAAGLHDGMDLRPHLEHLVDGAGGIASGGAQASLTCPVGWRHARAAPPESTQIWREVVLFGEDEMPHVLHRRPVARRWPLVQTRRLDGSKHLAECRHGIFGALKGCERTGFVRQDPQIYVRANDRCQVARAECRCSYVLSPPHRFHRRGTKPFAERLTQLRSGDVAPKEREPL
jgi:hypothetical protein